MRITEYTLHSDAPPLRVAVVADFHDQKGQTVIEALRQGKPDIILVPGDVIHGKGCTDNAFAFLRSAVTLAPVFCSIGNHEVRCGEEIVAQLAATGAQVLEDRYVHFGGLVIGGLTTGYSGCQQGRLRKTPEPQLAWLDDFCAQSGVKVLLSHHPEYYPRYLCERSVELVLSGHAHGGQWRLLGQGLFAPGQGFFPRFTSGAYRGKRKVSAPFVLSDTEPLMIVSRGLCNRSLVPRLNNPEELIFLNFEYTETGTCMKDIENE